MRRAGSAVLVIAASVYLGACASAPVPARLVDIEDFVYPVPELGTLRAKDIDRLESAWRDLVRGKPARAERRFLKLQRSYPRAAAPETGVAYARLRADYNEAAQASFLAVLARNPGYLPALVGAATAARRNGEPEVAVEFYRRALAADSTAPPTVRRRLGEAKLEATETRVQAARRALAAGQPAQAETELRRGLRAAPEVAGLRIGLAEILVQRENPAAAIEILEADPTFDRQVALRLGQLLMQQGQPERAERVYLRLLAEDPHDAETARLVPEARRAAELRRMPEEYRRIFDATRVTRADLAALLALKVSGLARLPQREPPVATDISGSWARDHVLRVLALGIMDVYPNHTFKPAEAVRRGELAQAVTRTLDLLGRPVPPLPTLADMSPAHLYHGAAARAVSEGIMDLTPEGHFQPWRGVTGPEAVLVVEALARLAGS